MLREKTMRELIQKYGTLFLPDMGTFFNDDEELAVHMVDRLLDAKIPVVKGEILHDVNVCLKSGFIDEYYSPENNIMIKENYREIIERKVVSLDAYERIFKRVLDKKAQFVLSVYDQEGADFANQIGSIAIKVASSNVTHQPLIEYLSTIEKPILLDTGHCTLEEISRAVNWFNDAGKFDIILQHSPLAPPVPIEEHNLRFMKTLGTSFNLPFGLSDHHVGEEMLYASTAMGAVVVEKGVCPDEMGDDQDRAHALNISQVATVQKKIQNIATGLGTGVRTLRRDRVKYRSRMCIYATTDINTGDQLTTENISFAFPLIGIGVEYAEQVIGRKVKISVKKGQPINWSDL